jgi:hypothetical protein
MTIVNDDSRVINKLEASLTDNARVVIYNRHMFIVQATAVWTCLPVTNTLAYHTVAQITAVKSFTVQTPEDPEITRTQNRNKLIFLETTFLQEIKRHGVESFVQGIDG